jgi:hypothetical protein
VVLYVKSSSGGGPSLPTALSGTLTANTEVDFNANGLNGNTEYYVPDGQTLNLNGAPLTVKDLAGAIAYGTYTIVDDENAGYNLTGSNSHYKITGEFSYDGSLAPSGTAITVGSGSNTYVLRIFYPENSFNADGSDLKDVILERQSPLQVLGTDVPFSSGMAYDGIVVNASYAAHSYSNVYYKAYSDPGVLDPNYYIGGNPSNPQNPGYETSDSGAIERSMITQITITFTGIVDSVDPGAVTLVNRELPAANATVNLTYTSLERSGDRSVLVINFTGGDSSTYQRSVDGVWALNNDNYELQINGANVAVPGSGIVHSLGNDGLAGQKSKVDAFYALYGDLYGQGSVGAADGFWLGYHIYEIAVSDPTWVAGNTFYGGVGCASPTYTANYDPAVMYFDQNGQGYVDQTENANFAPNVIGTFIGVEPLL